MRQVAAHAAGFYEQALLLSRGRFINSVAVCRLRRLRREDAALMEIIEPDSENRDRREAVPIWIPCTALAALKSPWCNH